MMQDRFGTYDVSAPAFSQEYDISGSGGRIVASFRAPAAGLVLGHLY
ncbi:hypothetical protein Q0F98_23685 [Paenibacillus amylolyticus]|nr:hypothetical protein Q0F98_23685 [Paenibacillus amylolyticus]